MGQANRFQVLMRKKL